MNALVLAAMVVSLSQAPAVVETPPPPPPEWVGTIGLNLIALQGNANSVTVSTSGAAERKSEDWRFSGKFGAAYGEATLETTTGETVNIVARAASGQLRMDRKLSPFAALFALAGVEFDHVKSLELRPLGEVGVALTWLDLKRADQTWISLRTDLGVRYAYDYRYDYFADPPHDLDDLPLLAPKLGVGFRWAITPTFAFLEDGEIMYGVLEGGRVIASSLTRLQAKLIGPLAFSAGVEVKYDSVPAEGKVPTDVIYTTGIEVAF